MLKILYNSFLFCYAVCTLPKVLWQWCLHGKYKGTLQYRFGFKLPKISLAPEQKLLWIHAISMGETRAIIPLFRDLRERFPDLKIVISSTTETGHAEAKRSMPEAASHFYLPFDFSWVIKKFMRHLRPSYLILVESDIWYHLLSEAKKQGASLILVNGKISERSARRFQKISAFSKKLFSLFDVLCVQNDLYRERFLALGADPNTLYVTGNIKLDVKVLPMNVFEKQRFKEELGIETQDRVLVIGSSHEPEEAWLLSALNPLFTQIPHLKILLVPRHPERFARVACLLKERHIDTLIYSKRSEKKGGEKVVLIDAMGLLNTCYQIAEIAIVAGSFISSVGGHNIFEPIIYHTPVLFGPHMYGQPDLKQIILKAGAGKQVTLQELPSVVLDWIQNPISRENYVAAGQALIIEVRGSVQRTLNHILPCLVR